MTIAAQFDRDESPGSALQPSLDTQAASSLAAWYDATPSAAGEFTEAARASTLVQQEQQREADAVRAERTARQQAASLAARLDLAGHRILAFTAGAAIVVALLGFDVVPLYWAAQAFGLPNADSWLVTALLLLASAGAMAGLELTREDRSQRALLVGLIAAAFFGLIVLRAEYLMTAQAEPLGTAVLQAVMLSGISAVLVVFGSAVMARTRSLALGRALAAARSARRARAACERARRRAEEKMQRHWAVLQRMLREWSITSPAPAGASQAEWTDALERALLALFPGQ